MNTITLINEKGGVGKTTLTRLFALGLAERGHRVIVLDADGQGDLTRSLGVRMAPHFNDFCRRPDVDLRHLIERVPMDITPAHLYVVAGNSETWGIAGSARKKEIVATMASRMRQLSRGFDYCLIDTQPSPTMLHDAIGMVSRFMIFPTDAEKFSAEGGLTSSIQNVRANHEDGLARGYRFSEPLAIIPNKFRQRTTLHNVFLERLIEEWGDLVWEPLALTTTVPEEQTILGNIQGTHPDLTISQVISRMLDRIEGASINA